VFIILFTQLAQAVDKTKKPIALLEKNLDYKLNMPALVEGNFQYFYSLLKQVKGKIGIQFRNLSLQQSQEETDRVANTFMPLDTNNSWDIEDKNFLAVAKFSYILPININKVTPTKFSTVKYLQSTLPRYTVSKTKEYYEIGGSMITPSFDAYLDFIGHKHPYTKFIKEINSDKMKNGKMKVSFMYQNNFGRVMLFKTAKMASAMMIYQESGPKHTLVTQYIFSNVINVPLKILIRKGMIENLQNVVSGSRASVLEFK
jgi:hypothetical protein